LHVGREVINSWSLCLAHNLTGMFAAAATVAGYTQASAYISQSGHPILAKRTDLLIGNTATEADVHFPGSSLLMTDLA